MVWGEAMHPGDGNTVGGGGGIAGKGIWVRRRCREGEGDDMGEGSRHRVGDGAAPRRGGGITWKGRAYE